MFGAYLNLGFEHILDPYGFDHVLFLIALTISYTLGDWKKVILLATAFTLGHSLTLILSAIDVFRIDSAVVEILIAASIMVTAFFNIFRRGRSDKMAWRYLLAFAFGLVHGMGFSNYFRAILGNDEIIMPLLAFNIGVELAQVIIVLVVILLNQGISSLLKDKYRYWEILISVMIIIASALLIIERI